MMTRFNGDNGKAMWSWL